MDIVRYHSLKNQYTYPQRTRACTRSARTHDTAFAESCGSLFIALLTEIPFLFYGMLCIVNSQIRIATLSTCVYASHFRTMTTINDDCSAQATTVYANGRSSLSFALFFISKSLSGIGHSCCCCYLLTVVVTYLCS